MLTSKLSVKDSNLIFVAGVDEDPDGRQIPSDDLSVSEQRSGENDAVPERIGYQLKLPRIPEVVLIDDLTKKSR